MTEDERKFGLAAFGELAARAEPKIQAALSARGVASVSELTREEASRIIEDALAATAVESFPTVDVAKMTLGFRNLLHPQFSSALVSVRRTLARGYGAFEHASGPEAAIILAGFGVQVAPLDKRTAQPLAALSNDVETVAANFNVRRTALVGYQADQVEFYVLATDCQRTLKERLASDRRMETIRVLMQRANVILPPDPGKRFQHLALLLARNEGDEVSSLAIEDHDPQRGSILFTAAWRDKDGGLHGIQNKGFVPALKSLIDRVANDMDVAHWLTEKKNSKTLMSN